MHTLMVLYPDLMAQEERERLQTLAAIHRKREMLAIAGYEPTGARLRARAAGWLIWLAARLDARAVEPVTPIALRHA